MLPMCLAWDLHAQFMDRLEPADADRVRQRQAEALRDLPVLARGQSQLPDALGVVPVDDAAAAATQLGTLLVA